MGISQTTVDRWPERSLLIVLEGLAGSGKTEVLHRLAALGEQTIDLEGLANHRGSVFGGLGCPPQPSHREFGLAALAAWYSTDPHKLLWMEDEGAFLGSVGIPIFLQRALAAAPAVQLVVPRERRLTRLSAEYGMYPREVLLAALMRARSRIGLERSTVARYALENGRVSAATEALLPYYDYAYQQRSRQLQRVILARFEPEHDLGVLIRRIKELVCSRGGRT